MKLIRPTPDSGFTLIELLVVISIIAILAGIALPVFGEVQVRGAQTKALSNAKQVGLACKVFATDYNGNFPYWTDPVNKTGTANDANSILETLIPDYIPDKGVFSIPKSAYCKSKGGGAATSTQLRAGDNEWAYVLGLTDTSNARFPLLADGFKQGSPGTYIADDAQPGGVWKAKKAVVIRVDISGTVETLYKANKTGDTATVKRSDDEPNKNAFEKDATSNPPWLSGQDVKVLNPQAPN
jgi:prepilin-type N-terminal cleavage/methylation domain-containing protein